MSNTRSTSSKRKAPRTLATTVMPAAETALEIRLWGGEFDDPTDIPAMALTMIADLLAASECKPRNGASPALGGTFPDAVSAIRTARHLQRLMRGYCSVLSRGALNCCVALWSEAEETPALQCSKLREIGIVEPSQPAPILLIGSLCESADAIPGLRLESVASGVLVAGEFGQTGRVLHLLPAIDAATGPDKPIEFAIVVEESVVEVVPEEPVVEEPVLPEVPLVVSLPDYTSQPPVADPEPSNASARKFPLPWIVGGGVAAAAVLGLIVFAAIPRSDSKPDSKTGQTPTQANPPAVNPVARPTQTPVLGAQPAAVRGKIEPDPNGSTPGPPKSRAELAREARLARKTPAAVDGDTEEPKPALSGGGGVAFSAAEISGLIAKADQDSSNGHFDEAITRYETVLKRDPNNALAIAGLARAKKKRDSQ